MVLYLDNNEAACSWVSELIADGLLPLGDVWCRDLTTIKPHEVEKYTQRHWCCGIGGWPLALLYANWDKPIDTISLPCQPFSVAGLQKGVKDDRHLWPAFYALIKELRPDVVVGEQVDAAIKLGWLDGVFHDLEAESYACGATVLPACSVGAPHIRKRIWWVAYSRHNAGSSEQRQQLQKRGGGVRKSGKDSGVGQSSSTDAGRDNAREGEGTWVGVEGRELLHCGRDEEKHKSDASMPCGGVDDPSRNGRERGRDGDTGRGARALQTEGYGAPCRVADSECAGLEGHSRNGERGNQSGRECEETIRSIAEGSGINSWDSIWHTCSDGKARRIPAEIESGILPLAARLSDFLGTDWLQGIVKEEEKIQRIHKCIEHMAGGMLTNYPLCGKVPGRVDLLKGAGNAIVPQVAAEFLQVVNEIIGSGEI